MQLQTHGDQKYRSSSVLGGVAQWNALRIEHRVIGPGRQNCVPPACTEVVHILSGQARVRRAADGQTQEGMAMPGTSWLVPAGIDETLLELDGTTECLIIFLPPKLLEDSALLDHGIDPAKAELAYVGGLADPALTQIGATLRGLLGKDRISQPIDMVFADGLRMALAAHLTANYARDSLRPAPPSHTLDPKRLKRVLDYIEAHVGEEISLGDLASQACLSPFHFSRLFRETTGFSPHRYLIERRMQAAMKLLERTRDSFAEIALDTGFGSQSNFARTFRKITGLTPRQYRELHSR